MKNDLGDAPIEKRYFEDMNALARSIDEILNGDAKGKARQTGFVLLVFPYGDREGRCNYISNGANREDIIVLFKEQIARMQGQADVKGTA